MSTSPPCCRCSYFGLVVSCCRTAWLRPTFVSLVSYLSSALVFVLVLVLVLVLVRAFVLVLVLVLVLVS